MDILYKTEMSANSSYHPLSKENIVQTHTGDEIIHHAKEVLAQQMGLDLCSFVGLEEVDVREDDGDRIDYVDKSGRRVEFTEALQLEAAIAVLNSNGHYFSVTPMNEIRSGAA